MSGCDTVSSIAGHGKQSLYDKFCSGQIDEYLDIFLETSSTVSKESLIKAGIAIFQYIYNGQNTPLGQLRYLTFMKKAAGGIIKPESLPPTEGAVTQHSLRAYLQLQDWPCLKSMSLDPLQYGWIISDHGYEPIPTEEPMAPDGLLKFTSCSCSGDCSSRRCSCKKNNVKCISACSNCKGLTCNNSHLGDEPEEEWEWEDVQNMDV